ncbi:hypothetical protein [Nocardia terrae]|uniref:hypothetical protein n=1 Tax=Nocardia terrae TaxID=2675851 RepID=UPI0012FA6084|nr:hypothetical protein [Nocardia terrae]
MTETDKTPEPAAEADETVSAKEIKGPKFTAVPILSVVVTIFAVIAVTFGVLWHNTSDDYTALKSNQSDRDRAAEVAKEYTLRSLTYNYKDLPAFFDGVQHGTSAALRDRYSQVHDTLAKIMTDAQVVATGDVVGTSVEPKGNNQYSVTVYATQKTQNVQQPDPATVPNLLVLTVAKNGGDWVVTDYGPKDIGVKGGTAK